MTQSQNITNHPGIARLPAGLTGFCCEDRNCPECLWAYRAPRRDLRQARASCPAQAAQAEHPQAGGAGGEDRQARDQRHHAGRDDHQFR